jgi:hypothetical protein
MDYEGSADAGNEILDSYWMMIPMILSGIFFAIGTAIFGGSYLMIRMIMRKQNRRPPVLNPIASSEGAVPPGA